MCVSRFYRLCLGYSSILFSFYVNSDICRVGQTAKWAKSTQPCQQPFLFRSITKFVKIAVFRLTFMSTEFISTATHGDQFGQRQPFFINFGYKGRLPRHKSTRCCKCVSVGCDCFMRQTNRALCRRLCGKGERGRTREAKGMKF